MPSYGPIKHKEFVRCLRKAGFDGPYQGGKHPFMLKEKITLTIPNPHKGDIGVSLLHRILKQAEISRDEWERI